MSSPPAFLQPFLWSYDLSRMDVEKDKHLIIRHVLEYGTAEATDWLFCTYSADDIKLSIRESSRSEWSEKSLALWRLVFDAYPARAGRFA